MFTFDLWRSDTKDRSSQLPAISSTKICLQTQYLHHVWSLAKLILVPAFELEMIQYKDPRTAFQEENGIILPLCQSHVCKISRRLVAI